MFELDDVQQLRDDALIEQLTRSVRADRQWTVRLLIELAEVQARGLYRELGFSSLFDFATRKLRMSEAEAGLRIRAARVGRKFPVALELLARQEVNLTTLSLLARVLSDETLSLLHAARFKSKQEVLELLARHAPKPDAPDSVRRVPPPRASARAPRIERAPSPREAAGQGAHSDASAMSALGSPAVVAQSARASVVISRQAALRLEQVGANSVAALGLAPSCAESFSAVTSPQAGSRRGHAAASSVSALGQAPSFAESSSAVISRQAGSRRGHAAANSTDALGRPASCAQSSSTNAVVPLSSERHKISFTGSQRLRDLLREAQDLRRHRFPAGDLEPLFERALELLVAHEKKRKFGLTLTPRACASTSGHPNSRSIPNAVRRQAWLRHGGQCCFVAADGRRCQARSRLEFHHVVPFARGGPSRLDNIVLVCQAHNLLHAEHDYGRAFMQRCVERSVSESGRGSRVIPGPEGLADSSAQARSP